MSAEINSTAQATPGRFGDLDDPGMTHYVGDTCPGGHRDDDITPDERALTASLRRTQSIALASAVLDAVLAVDPGYDGPCPGTGLGDGACPACGHENTRRHAVTMEAR